MVEKKINSNKFSKNKNIKLFVFTRRILYKQSRNYEYPTMNDFFFYIIIFFIIYMYLGVYPGNTLDSSPFWVLIH